MLDAKSAPLDTPSDTPLNIPFNTPFDTPSRIIGAGTWLDAGRPVVAPARISTREQSGVVEYVPGDLVITVRAGTSLGEIADVTAAHGQWLPLDPYTSCALTRDNRSDVGTIGATVATSSYGPLAHGFGRTRDIVLGLKSMNANGDELQFGGRVVKNVAGFDVVRLFTGSWGTLGVITEVSIRLRAQPTVDETFLIPIAASTLATVAQQLNSAPLLASTMSLAACVILSSTAANIVNLTNHVSSNTMLVMVRATGNRARVSALKASLETLGAATTASSDVWRAVRQLDIGNTTFRVTDAPSRLANTLRQTHDWCVEGNDGDSACVVMEPMRGAVRVSCTLPASPATHAPLPTAAIVERIPTAWWKHVPSAVGDHISTRLLRAFDPSGVFNPGILGATGATNATNT